MSRQIKLFEFAQRDTLDIDESSYASKSEQGFGVGVLERLDHLLILTRYVSNVKHRYFCSRGLKPTSTISGAGQSRHWRADRVPRVPGVVVDTPGGLGDA